MEKNLAVGVYNLDSTKRPPEIKMPLMLYEYIRATPIPADVSTYTEVSMKAFAKDMAGLTPATSYSQHTFSQGDATAQVFPTEWATDEPTTVVQRAKFMRTALRVNGQDVAIYSVHMPRVRKRRTEAFARLVADIDDLRTAGTHNEIIVCGDFNHQVGDVIKLFDGTGLQPAVRAEDPRTAASGHLDNVFTSAKIRGVRRWEDSHFTHVPLAADVSIEK